MSLNPFNNFVIFSFRSFFPITEPIFTIQNILPTDTFSYQSIHPYILFNNKRQSLLLKNFIDFIFFHLCEINKNSILYISEILI